MWLLMLVGLSGSTFAQDLLRPRFARLPLEEGPTSPLAFITVPTTSPTIGVSTEVVVIEGTCVDNTACTSVTWACPECSVTSGTADGTANWSFSVTLAVGENVVTVTPHDAAMDTPITDAIEITYTEDDMTDPIVEILEPTTDPTDTVSVSPYPIEGTSTDNVGVTGVSWVNSTGGSGNATGGTPAWSALIPLTVGENILTITAVDQAANAGTAEITVTLLPPLLIDQTSLTNGTEGVADERQLSATGGAGSNVWTNDGAGTTLNDADAQCAATSISAGGLVSWTSGVGAGVCSFVARVTDSAMTSDTQPFNLTFASGSAEGPHDFFETLIDLPEVAAEDHHSLRTQPDIEAVDVGNGNAFTYEFGTDTYENPQDAAKLTWVPARISLTQTAQVLGSHMHMPVHEDTGVVLFVWDVWHGPEWRHVSCTGGLLNISPQLVHKQYRLRFLNAGANTGDGGITVEVKEQYITGGGPASGSCSDVIVVSMRSYIGPAPAGMDSDLTNLQPTGQGAEDYLTFPVKHSTWTRYWMEVQLNVDETAFTSWNTFTGETVAPGTYHMISLWIADETREPTRIYYKTPWGRLNGMNIRDEIGIFDYEMDTSANHYAATGTVTFTGTEEGKIIPNNTQMDRGDGVRYTTQGQVAISGGVAVAQATAIESTWGGPIGNASVGTDLTLVTPITNVSSAVEMSSDFTGGAYINNGNLYSYFRNWVMLKDYVLPANPEDDTVIFKKPVP